MVTAVVTTDQHQCLHCGALSPGEFCCSGCKFVYQTIHGLGLAEFYRYRTIDEAAGARPPDVNLPSYSSYDDSAFRESHFRKLSSGELQGALHLSGIHCAGCVWLIEKLPQILPGVRTARLNFAEGNLELTFDPERAALSEIGSFLHSIGYPSCPLEERQMAAAEKKEDRILLLRLGIAGFAAANTMLLAVSLFQGLFSGIEQEYANLFRWTSLIIATPAIGFSALPFYRAAFGALRTRRFHIDLPISVAILAAFFLSAWNTVTGNENVYFDSAAALVFLLLASRYIQRRALQRARREAHAGWSFMPATARLIRGDARTLVSLRELKPGDLVEVLPGERFPSDGSVEKGDSSVDRSILTGESLPKRVMCGETVDGGTLNILAPLEVRIGSSFAASRLGRLLEEMKQGERRPARFLGFTEQVSAVFVGTVLLLAAITLAMRWHLGPREAVESALALLIVTCPCALALASPLMMALAISRAARRGILIKHVDSLEQLRHVREVYFDKTGTLTTGSLAVNRFYVEGRSEAALAVSAELAALTPSHPVAAAIFRMASGGAPVERRLSNPELTAGRGVSAWEDATVWRLGSYRWISSLATSFSDEAMAFIRGAEDSGSGISILSRGPDAVAIFVLDDEVKPSAEDCLLSLREQGYFLSILSGDRLPVVRALGTKLGISADRCHGEMYPEEKRAHLLDRGAVTAMIGDGMNDGAALQAADVGIAVAGGIQPNIEVADIIIPDGDLGGVCAVFSGSRKIFRRLKLILAISAVYNICGAGLAMAGMMNPLIAALVMPLSSISVISIALFSDPFALSPEDDT